MLDLTAEQLAQRAFDFNLLTDQQLRDVWGQLGSRSATRDELKQVLLRRELLTSYQIEKILRGEKSGYFYGPYKMMYVIGSGTFARVYRALHKINGETRAVKVLRGKFSESADNRHKFSQEGELGVQLRHPNIVPIFEVASEGNQPYLVMEFLEGRNLREFIKIRQKFEPVEAVKLITDVARGLDYAFKKGIQHRDLKTSNVLVTSSGVAKLVDFGLAAADSSHSDDATIDVENPRTIDYAALERYSGVRKGDNRSDIFFLGCMFYHMLAGVPALSETTDRIQRMARTRFSSVVPLFEAAPDVPRAVSMIAVKAMELSPKLRYQNPGEVLHDLNVLAQRMADGQVMDAATIIASSKQRIVMIVESNTKLQDMLRERLKLSGFRVLVSNDPNRPHEFFAERDRPADCVIFGAVGLEETALAAFNQFGESERTQKVPAILLLNEKVRDWQTTARLNDHRVSLRMPITVKQLVEQLNRLVPADSITPA